MSASPAAPHRSVTGLDGVTRPWDDVFEQRHVPGLGLDSLVGHVVRRTYFDGRPHVDVAHIDGADRYGAALDLARSERALDDQYAVVDSVHELPNGQRIRLNG